MITFMGNIEHSRSSAFRAEKVSLFNQLNDSILSLRLEGAWEHLEMYCSLFLATNIV